VTATQELVVAIANVAARLLTYQTRPGKRLGITQDMVNQSVDVARAIIKAVEGRPDVSETQAAVIKELRKDNKVLADALQSSENSA